MGKFQLNNSDCTNTFAGYFLNAEEPRERLIFNKPSSRNSDSVLPTREEIEVIKSLRRRLNSSSNVETCR